VLRRAAFKEADASAAETKPDDESVDPFTIGFLCEAEWVRV